MGSGKTAVSKVDKNLCPHGASVLEKGGNYTVIIRERENLTLWLLMSLGSDVLM